MVKQLTRNESDDANSGDDEEGADWGPSRTLDEIIEAYAAE